MSTIENALKVAYSYANTKYLQDEYNVNKKRYYETLKLLTETVPEKATVLEVGCAPGLFALALAQFNYSIHSIDLNPNECISAVQENVDLKKCDLDLTQIPYKENVFDCVIFTEVFEHLHPFRTKKVLEEIHRCLKPKGTLIFSTPNLFALENRLFMLFGGTSALGGGITPPHHTREYGMKEVINILQESNFKIETKYYSSARDLVTVKESWKNTGRKILYPFKKIVPPFRSTMFVIATKA